MRALRGLVPAVVVTVVAQLVLVPPVAGATAVESRAGVIEAKAFGASCTAESTTEPSWDEAQECGGPVTGSGDAESSAALNFTESPLDGDLRTIEAAGETDASSSTVAEPDDPNCCTASGAANYFIQFRLGAQADVHLSGELTETTNGPSHPCAFVRLASSTTTYFSVEGPGGPGLQSPSTCTDGDGSSSFSFEGVLPAGELITLSLIASAPTKTNAVDNDAIPAAEATSAGYEVAFTLDCDISGTPAADVLNGTEGNDVICGLGEGDTIDGLGGNDLIEGGGGDDVIFGGGGTDTVDGGDGSDEIHGGGDNDTLLGGEGTDRIRGDAGEDLILGEAGDDSTPDGEIPSEWGLVGGDGVDTIFGGFGVDLIDGGNDPDQLQGGDGEDILLGGAGEDNMLGGADRDFLHGDTEDDILLGGNGNDFLSGEAGGDTILGEAGNDDLYGDFFPQDVGRDRLEGGRGEDNLLGGPDRDCLIGGAQKDTMKGENGRDTFIARDGRRDTVKGGPGNDRGRFDGIDNINSVADRNHQGGCG